MRVPISWLKEYVDVSLSPEELAELLTLAGLEVTAIDLYGIAGAPLEWDREKVILAHLLSVERHPDADKLVLATVEYGAEASKTVVTGAPNLFPYLDREGVAELGLTSPMILEGATYLDPYKDSRPTRLKGKKLRGIYNDAMLCSPVELGLGEEHEGILLVEKGGLGDSSHPPGTPLQDVLGDAVLEIDIIPNISRCASIVGVAREIAALTGAELRLPSYEVQMEGRSTEGLVRITADEPELNPRFVALVVEGVEQKPAPFWMQQRLRLAGQRPINVVVDVSNYVMLETGQPNHAFDYDFLRGRADEYDPSGPIHIVTRLARSGETMTTLDELERKLHPNNILVTDPAGCLSLGGVMGGLNSEIRPETTNVLLEAAAWNFLNIRQTCRQLGLQTEASFRFSRGVHPNQALLGARRAAELLRTLAGGSVAQGIIDEEPCPAPEVIIELDPDYVRRLSGLDLSKAEIAGLLERLEFEVAEDDGAGLLSVVVPDHRIDVDGPHDLVEEVCRIYGYGRIPSTVLGDVLPVQRGNPAMESEERIKDILCGQGLREVITYRLTTEEAEARITSEEQEEARYIKLANPSTQDRVALRRSLLASLLEVVAANTRFQDSIAVFEVGQVYLAKTAKSLASPGRSPGWWWSSPARVGAEGWEGEEPPLLDFYDLKGVVENLADGLKLTLEWVDGQHESLVREGQPSSGWRQREEDRCGRRAPPRGGGPV